MPNENGWIWCEEQLPELHEPVLVFRPKLGEFSIAKYAGDLGWWMHQLSNGWATMYIAPAAWHPLPAPPIAEDREAEHVE